MHFILQYPLGLYDCNETKTADVVQLLKKLSNMYVPMKDDEIVEPVFFGGLSFIFFFYLIVNTSTSRNIYTMLHLQYYEYKLVFKEIKFRTHPTLYSSLKTDIRSCYGSISIAYILLNIMTVYLTCEKLT